MGKNDSILLWNKITLDFSFKMGVSSNYLYILYITADLQIMGLTHILLLVEVLSLLQANEIPNRRCVLNILSILPYPSTMFTVVRSDGPDIIPAGYLALEAINKRSDILGDYHLELIDGQAGCGAAVLELSERVLVKEIFYSEKNIVGLVGPWCYDSAERVGLVTAKDGIALINIHMSSASILGNATLYPYSMGTTPSILRFVDALTALMRHSGWTHIAVLYQDNTSFYSVFKDLSIKVKRIKDYTIAFSSILTENYIPLDSMDSSPAHVVLAACDTVLAKRLMCMVFHKRMLFPKYQWIFLYQKLEDFSATELQYGNRWYSCNKEDMLIALNNSISIDFNYEPDNDDKLDSGLTYSEYKKEYSNAVNRYNSGKYGKPVRIATISPLGNNFHDAIWILALALNATDGWMKANNKTMCEYGYGNPTIANRIQNEVSKTRFVGASGVNSYGNGTRFTLGSVLLAQFVSGEAHDIAVYLDNDHLRFTSQNVPLLSTPIKKCKISLAMSVTSLLFVLVAFVVVALINAFNIVFREHSSVRASSYRLNHLAYVGCYSLSIGITILSVTERFYFSLHVKTYLCNIIPWTVSIGFTLVYATVIVKLCRLYRLLVLSARNLRPPTGGKPLNDAVLMAIVIAFTVPNIIICSLWMYLDPIIVISDLNFDTKTEKPLLIVFESCIINGKRFPIMWFGILLAYEGILCTIAGFISFLTRSISIKNFKTGNILLLSTLLFISGGVGLPTLLILMTLNMDSEARHKSLFVAWFVLLMVSVYLCVFLLLLPPVYRVVKERIMIWHRK